MEFTTIQLLRMFIEDEERDAFLYKELSNRAPTTKIREILFSMSMDEQSHSEKFKKIYKSITGRTFSPIVIPPDLNGNFRDIITNQILGETEGYIKYSEQYYRNNKNKALKDAYFTASTDENAHAHKLGYILDVLKEN
ncbi:MAG: ferritin-like domain-containing protein [Clostridiales bacterium]|nr:ferritin-like domain-containing protein [Clostridiales bacterium]